MTIKKQKIIRFIPIIQFITVFCWLKYYVTKHVKWSNFAKTLFKMFVIVILIHLPRLILHFIFTNEVLDNILYYLSLYPAFFAIATMSVADQELCENQK